jgi:hypothetical protein
LPTAYDRLVLIAANKAVKKFNTNHTKLVIRLFMSLEDGFKLFVSKAPQLRVMLTLYPAEKSSRSQAIVPGWMCPCVVNKTEVPEASDGAPILKDGPMQLGEMREVDFLFPLAGKDVIPLAAGSPKFYLWEGGYIGEAQVLEIYD